MFSNHDPKNPTQHLEFTNWLMGLLDIRHWASWVLAPNTTRSEWTQAMKCTQLSTLIVMFYAIGVTYHRMVNKLFKEMLGMNMLVKKAIQKATSMHLTSKKPSNAWVSTVSALTNQCVPSRSNQGNSWGSGKCTRNWGYPRESQAD